MAFFLDSLLRLDQELEAIRYSLELPSGEYSPRHQRRKEICVDCKQIKLGMEKTLFKPIRLEHLALVATLRSFKKFTEKSVLGKSYATFEKIVRLVDARYYLVKFNNDKYAHISELIRLIDYKYSILEKFCFDFSKAQPTCCCAVLSPCVGSSLKIKRECRNYVPWQNTLHRFADMQNSHLGTNKPCCCDGMRTSECRMKHYIECGLGNRFK